MTQTPRLEEVTEAAIDNRLENFFTALPARVTYYSAAGNVVDLTMAVTNAFQDSTGTNITQWAKVVNVPVLFPGSGNNRMTYPLNQGDMVLYVVSSLPLQQFLHNGVTTGLAGAPRNNICSGFAIPGAFSYNKVPTEAPTDATVLHGDMTKIGGPTAEEFVALKKDLENLRTALQTAVITAGAGGAAAVVTACDTLAAGGSIPGGSPGVWPVGSTKLKVK